MQNWSAPLLWLSLMSSSQLPLYGYWALVLGIAVQRLVELRRSRRNEAWLKARGAQEVAPRHFMAMRCLHAVWLGGCIVEAAWRQQGPGLMISLVALVILVLGQSLRFAAMSALQKLDSAHSDPAGDAACDPRHIPLHPPSELCGVWYSNWAALPAIFGGWITAVVCSIANGVILCIRIRAEEAALEAAGGYKQAFAHTGRFFSVCTQKAVSMTSDSDGSIQRQIVAILHQHCGEYSIACGITGAFTRRPGPGQYGTHHPGPGN